MKPNLWKIEQKNKEIKRLWDIIKSKNNELRSASSNNHEEIELLTSNVKTEDNNTNTEELKSLLDLSNDRRKECEDLLMKIKNTVASEPVTKSTTKILEDIDSYFAKLPLQMQLAETTDTYDSELTHIQYVRKVSYWSLQTRFVAFSIYEWSNIILVIIGKMRAYLIKIFDNFKEEKIWKKIVCET